MANSYLKICTWEETILRKLSLVMVLLLLLLTACKNETNERGVDQKAYQQLLSDHQVKSEELDKLIVEKRDLENQLEELKAVNEQLMQDIKESQNLNDTLVSSDYLESYTANKFMERSGYYKFIGEDSPLIYPNASSPQVTDEVKNWLSENPLIEVIMRTNNDFYLVRIPKIENYVYVSEGNLGDRVDIPEISPIDLSINGCSIGDSVEKQN